MQIIESKKGKVRESDIVQVNDFLREYEFADFDDAKIKSIEAIGGVIMINRVIGKQNFFCIR